MFEMIDRDAFGRLGVLRTEHGTINTPTVLPVINPFKQTIPPSQIVESTGTQALITNAFILFRDPDARRRVLEIGIHDYLGVDCPVATDSGGYQIYRGQRVAVRPEEIHAFQAEIGSDLAVVLDVPPSDEMDERRSRLCVEESIRRARSLARSMPEGPLWYGVVHLTPHAALRRREAVAIAKLPFDVFALGSCVGSLVEYRFEPQIDRVMDTAKRLSPERPRHIFGVGHPMFLALSVAFGGDIFDSAMYALSAEGGRYLTPNGTMRLDGLTELPCSCPVCSRSTPEQLAGPGGVPLLAMHNLHATFEELRRVRQAIRDNRLWELAQARSRSHPNLLGAFDSALRRNRAILESSDPLTKRSALLYSGPESRLRPEVTRARRMIRERVPAGPTYAHPLYGRVPAVLALCYPFGQTELPPRLEALVKRPSETPSDIEVVKGSLDYQFGPGSGDALEPFQVFRSPKTGRIRIVRRGDSLLGTMRAKDFFFLPTMEGAQILLSGLPFPASRIMMSDEAKDFVSMGRSAFAKFVECCDPGIVPGQEVMLVDRNDQLLATGTALMNSREMGSFRVGVAAKIRHHRLAGRPLGEDLP